jgi:hypothetical protein
MSNRQHKKRKIEALNLVLIFAMSFLVLFLGQTGQFLTARKTSVYLAVGIAKPAAL